jgi:pyridoxal phosphate enzyme (YggS family)
MRAGEQEAAAISGRLGAIRERMAAACGRAGRDPAEVSLLAVSKTFPASAIRAAYDAGQRLFGENYVQEWQRKAEDPLLLGLRDLRWHMIGMLQRNKIRFLLGRVDCIETLDRRSLAEELSRRALERPGGGPQRVLAEVNVGHEGSKAGWSPEQLREAWGGLRALAGLRIDGLMSIPPPREDPEEARADHRALRALRDDLRARWGDALPVLSLGMSHDFEVAIQEGSTQVRVGTAIFGERS